MSAPGPGDFLALLPALWASGKTIEATQDIYDLLPTLAPLLDNSQSWTDFVDKLPQLHASGQFGRMGADVASLWRILDGELGDKANAPAILAFLKKLAPPK